MMSTIRIASHNGRSFLYEREDAFTSLLKPHLATLNACGVPEEDKPKADSRPVKPKPVRYVQLTAEEYAEQRAQKVAQQKEITAQQAIEDARQAKADARTKSLARASVADNPRMYSKWAEWEEYCLKRFVLTMTPEEVAKSLQRPIRGVKSKVCRMGLKWTYPSEEARAEILAEARNKQANIGKVERVNSSQFH